jgi:hypothetical protein
VESKGGKGKVAVKATVVEVVDIVRGSEGVTIIRRG